MKMNEVPTQKVIEKLTAKIATLIYQNAVMEAKIEQLTEQLESKGVNNGGHLHLENRIA